MAPNDERNVPPSPPEKEISDTMVGVSLEVLLPSPPESPSSISLPDKKERESYYYGLEAQPTLLARSSPDIWDVALSLGPFSNPEPKQLKNVGKHKLIDIWNDTMAAHVLQILKMYSVKWNSIDILRIGHERQDKPVVLWIGVVPGSLTKEDGTPLAVAGKVVVACRQFLESVEIFDVHCEMKESEIYRGAGPALVKPSVHSTSVVDVQVFLTPTLGTCISAKGNTSEGTFGFYVTFPNYPGKVFGVTCRHVLFSLVGHENRIYRYKSSSQPRRLVILPGDSSLNVLKERIVKGCDGQRLIVDRYERELAAVTGQDQDARRARKRAQDQIDNAKEIIEDFKQLSQDLNIAWTTSENRVVGHVVFSPPIDVGSGPDNFTVDWCLYEVDLSKIENFSGNVIDLGQDVTVERLNEALNPNIKNPYKFSYPPGRQWSIQNNCVSLEEMRRPQTFDKDNNPALSVLKRGRTTAVTCGVANEIESYLRHYFDDANPFTSKEFAVLGFDRSFSPFSARGDSGAIVVDARGRLVGMLTGGSGYSARTDVTYVMPMIFLLRDMEKHGWQKPNTNVGPLEKD